MSLLRQTILSVLTEALTAEEVYDLVEAVSPSSHTKSEVMGELLKMSRQGIAIKSSKRNPISRKFVNTYELTLDDVELPENNLPSPLPLPVEPISIEEIPMPAPKAEFVEFFSLARVIMGKLDGINSLFISSDKITLLANGVAYDIETPDDLAQIISALETLAKLKQGSNDE